MKDFLLHTFTPRESNNYRAKFLHQTNIFLAIVLFLLAGIFVQQTRTSFTSVLGINANISVSELLRLTNEQREKNGVEPLSINEKLVIAADQKALDMLEYDYWAHNSPLGRTPWFFIKSSGYKYVYAGENLAKGFTNAEDIVTAWMDSPDHRANMLSSNYEDVGFAIREGELDGEETILIVQEFGNLNMVAGSSSQDTSAAQDTRGKEEISINRNPLIDTKILSSNTLVFIIGMFVFVLALDLIIVIRMRFIRFVGHNIDHIMYLLLILFLAGVLTKGVAI
jgi:uncharacterized protein YkwD